jgi:hypothetical protein
MQTTGIVTIMAERDTNKEALEQVEKATESDPVKGEELLESQDLQRQLSEAKESEAKRQRKSDPPSP